MFDVDASALAMGVIDSEPIFIITGTCGINGYISPKPVSNRSIMFNSLYSLPGMYLIEEGSATSAGVLEWVIGTMFSQEDEAIPYAQIDAMIDASDVKSVKPLFLPFLYGFLHGGTEGSLASRGAWVGLCPEHTRADMLRAVYEGVVFAHRMHVEHLLHNRPRPSHILLAGGASFSDMWTQMFADALQVPIEVVENAEMGAKGVAIASAVAVGLYANMQSATEQMTEARRRIEPRTAYAALYAKKYEAFAATVRCMEEVWPHLKD